jgi:hypothetical protein
MLSGYNEACLMHIDKKKMLRVGYNCLHIAVIPAEAGIHN